MSEIVWQCDIQRRSFQNNQLFEIKWYVYINVCNWRYNLYTVFVVFNKKLRNQYFLCWAVYQLKETKALCIMYSHKHYPTTQNLCWHNSSWIQSFCTGNCIWNCHLIYNLLVWMYCKEKLTKLHTVPKLFHNSRKPKQKEKIIVRTLIMFFK